MHPVVAATGSTPAGTPTRASNVKPDDRVAHMPHDVAVVPGSGAIGGMLMWVLLRNPKLNVWGVFREETVEAYRKDGVSFTFEGVHDVMLPSRRHPNLRFVGGLKDVPEHAWLLDAVQSHQLLNSLTDVKVTHRLVLLQNGQGHYEKVRRFRKAPVEVYKGVVHVASAKTKSGAIEPKRGKIQVQADQAVAPMLRVVSEGNPVFRLEEVPDIDVASWLKTAMNLGLNGLSLIKETRFGPLATDPSLWVLVGKVIDEGCDVAWADLKDKAPDRAYLKDNTLDDMKAKARADFQERAAQHPEHLSSMQNTFIEGKEIEIGPLYEYVASRADELHVLAPLNELLTTTLQFLQDKRRLCKTHADFLEMHAEARARAVTDVFGTTERDRSGPPDEAVTASRPRAHRLWRPRSIPGTLTIGDFQLRLRVPGTGTKGSSRFELR